MADYLILKKNEQQTGPSAWQVLNLSRDKTADQAGALEALRESYNGPGKYGICRVDNARTANVQANPAITEDPTPEF